MTIRTPRGLSAWHTAAGANRLRDKPGVTPPAGPAPPPAPWWRGWLLVWALAVFLLLFFGPGLYASTRTVELPYSTFLTDLQHHQVTTVAVGSNGQLTGTLAGGQRFTTQAPLWALTTSDLSSRLESSGAQVSAYQQGDTLRQLIVSVLPTLLFIGAFVWLGRRAQQALSSGGGLGGGLLRSRARTGDAERPRTRFSDVAGYDGVKQEVREVVDFLQHPQRYRRAGAQGPRGMLLVGPPGTGKTLLARAVAGEASVPFYAVTASSFVEVFVGLGASRARELFAAARRNAPAIVFIDEIDAIGARRSVPGVGGNDEREQTLNQLLAEMDGFTQETSVVVLANTNRPEVLDPALLRPGRFDRQVQVPLPTLRDRERILAVHAHGKRLALGVDLSVVARGTPGFSGADLANLVNEAALHAARHDRDELGPADFEEARERLILGRRDDWTVLLPAERHTGMITRRHDRRRGIHASFASHRRGRLPANPVLMRVVEDHALPTSEITIFPTLDVQRFHWTGRYSRSP